MHPFFYHIDADLEAFKSALINIDLEKLELFGDEYYFEFIRQWDYERGYKFYVTDALKAIVGNTARLAGGSTLNRRYFDIITPEKQEPERKPEEIIDIVNRKCGLIMIDESEVESNERECI